MLLIWEGVLNIKKFWCLESAIAVCKQVKHMIGLQHFNVQNIILYYVNVIINCLLLRHVKSTCKNRLVIHLRFTYFCFTFHWSLTVVVIFDFLSLTINWRHVQTENLKCKALVLNDQTDMHPIQMFCRRLLLIVKTT